MQPSNLLDNILSSSIDDKLVLISENENSSLRTLKEDSILFRSRYKNLKNSNCLIISENSFHLARHLIFLDGFVSNLTLIPTSLSINDKYKELIDTEKFNHIIHILHDELKIKKLKDPKVNQNLITLTKWVLLTSGTSGEPKALVHDFNSLTKRVSSKKQGELIWGLTYGLDRFAGLQVFLQSILSNQCLVIPNHNSNFNEQIDLFLQNKVNALSATPSFWKKFLMNKSSEGFSFKQITLGGEIADQMILDSLHSKYKDSNIFHIYASTELGAIFCIKDKKEGFPKKIVDQSSNLKLIENELFVKSKSKASAYLNGTDLLLDKQGFFPTGDLVKIEGERAKFIGRKTGTINVGGNKVIPEEVETVINQLEYVQLSLVEGKKNSILGSLVCAKVKIKDNVEIDKKELKNLINQHCKDKLEQFKRPAMIKFVEEIKTNATGKILRD